MYQLEKIQPYHYDIKTNGNIDINHPIDGSKSDDEYEIGYLLDLVDKATDLDEKVVEDYTAAEVLCYLAHEGNIDTVGLESEENFFQSVFEAVKEYFDFEEEKVGIYHYDFETHRRVYDETHYQTGYLCHLLDKASTWDEEILPNYTALDILLSLVSAYDLWHYAPYLESIDSIFQSIKLDIKDDQLPSNSERFAKNEESGRLKILQMEREETIKNYVASVRQGIQEGQKEYKWLQSLDHLRQMKGCNKVVAQLETEWIERKRELEAERQAERQAIRKAEEASNPESQFLTLSIGYTSARFLDKGDLYEYEGGVYEVLFKEFFEEDGLSFGADENEYYEIDLKLLGEDDVRVIEYRTHKAKVAQAQKAKQAKDIAVHRISTVAEKGDSIGETSLAELVKDAVVLNSTFDLYGGGEMLLLKNNELFLIINNGYDGVSWKRNTIATSGAGAYGYHIPLTPELEDSVKVLTEKAHHE